MNLETDFTIQTLDFPDDYEGKVIATLIKANANESGRPAVLYVHGFQDYFYHPHVAEAYLGKGINFYALDLRKYGRSLLPHQHINYCKDLSEYFEEITAALHIIKEESGGKILYNGHSTGCLTGSLYMNKGEARDLIDAAVLNSPFLEFFLPNALKYAIKIVGGLSARFDPYANRIVPDSPYLKGLNNRTPFNPAWRLINDMPLFYKWALAAGRGHAFLQKKSRIEIPVLVMHSDKSVTPGLDVPELDISDGVLNVEHIKKYGPGLGSNVTMLEIKDAIHDVFMSPTPGVREGALEQAMTWVEKNFLHETQVHA